MSYVYLKAIHIIFVVTWFSGMFYLGRLFIYNREAIDLGDTEKNILHKQYNIMIKRLLMGIAWPSAVLTIILGCTIIIYHYSEIPTWLIFKLGMVLLLFLYHVSLHQIYVQQKNHIFKYSSTQLRYWNEVPTVFLVSIVFLAVVKQNMSVFYALIGLLIFIAFLMTMIRIYKNWRTQ